MSKMKFEKKIINFALTVVVMLHFSSDVRGAETVPPPTIKNNCWVTPGHRGTILHIYTNDNSSECNPGSLKDFWIELSKRGTKQLNIQNNCKYKVEPQGIVGTQAWFLNSWNNGMVNNTNVDQAYKYQIVTCSMNGLLCQCNTEEKEKNIPPICARQFKSSEEFIECFKFRLPQYGDELFDWTSKFGSLGDVSHCS